jgi:hypothetical protein
MARASGVILPGLRDLAISAITKESLAVPMTFPESSEARICELMTLQRWHAWRWNLPDSVCRG